MKKPEKAVVNNPFLLLSQEASKKAAKMLIEDLNLENAEDTSYLLTFSQLVNSVKEYHNI